MQARSLLNCAATAALGLAAALAPPALAQPDAWGPEIEQAVFKVRAGTDAGRHVHARTLGFLIGDRGLGITSFSVLQRAKKAGHVVFDDIESELDFDVLGVDTTANLALVRVDLSDVFELRRPVPLRFRDEPLGEGESIHVVGDWRLAGGARRAVSGTVSAVERCSDLPGPLRRTTGCSPASVWMRTDAPIHVTHTGGPVLDDNGDVVGLSTWAWTGNDAESLAIAADELRGLVTRFEDAEPLNLARERRGWRRIELAQSAFPILEMDQRDRVTKTLTSARALRRQVPCPTCDGTQVVRERRKVGERRLPGMVQPVYEWVEVTCQSNGGTGYNDIHRIVGKGNRVGPLEKYIGAIATMDPFDPKAPEAVADSRDELDKMMMLNPVTWTNRVINPQAKRRVSATVPEVGTPIIAVGMLTKGRENLGGLTPLRIVKLIQYTFEPDLFMAKYNAQGRQLVGQQWWEANLITIIDEPELIVHNPMLVDAIPGEIVMVTGLLAGYVHDQSGVRQPVIQDGFIVTPRPDLAFED